MPSAKWTRQLIRIDTDCGPVEVPATRVGPLAVILESDLTEKGSASHMCELDGALPAPTPGKRRSESLRH